MAALEDMEGDVSDELPNFTFNMFPEREDSEETGRFVTVAEGDVEKLISAEENANTKKKTSYDLTIVKKFLVEERNKTREIEEIQSHEVEGYLSQFVVAARTKGRKEYEPSSLRGILSSI